MLPKNDPPGHALSLFPFSVDPRMPQDEKQKMRVLAGGTRLFRRFSLQKVLGRGEMSVVWLARDHRLRRLVALKLVADAICRDPSARENLKGETRKNLLLTHPNIARVFDFVEDEQTAGICLEYTFHRLPHRQWLSPSG